MKQEGERSDPTHIVQYTHISSSLRFFLCAHHHAKAAQISGNPSPRLKVYSILWGLHHFITLRLMRRALTQQLRLPTTCEPANYSRSLERSRRPVGGLREKWGKNAAFWAAIKLQRTRCQRWASEFTSTWAWDTCIGWSTCDILWQAVRFTDLVHL